MRKMLVALTCVLMLLSATPAAPPTHAAANEPMLTAVPNSGPPGEVVTLHGSGYVPGGYIGTVRWDDVDQWTFTIPSGGDFSIPMTIPVDAPLGSHTVTVCTGNPCITGEFEQTASTTIEVTEAPPEIENDFFYGIDGQIPVQIALDRIGLLAQDGVSTQEIQSFVGQTYNLQLAEELPGGILIFRMPVTRQRMAIVELARTILEEGSNLVMQAGLVLPPNVEEHPVSISSDQFIVQFGPNVVESDIQDLNAANGVEIAMENPYQENEYLLRVTPASGVDGITMANRYHEESQTVYAHPNFIVPRDLREMIPSDTLFANQWHHRNVGDAGGTPDADADTSHAWDITMGSTGVLLAIIDDGFDMGHPDLTPNYHPTLRWDFRGCDSASATIACGDNDPSPVSIRDNHGTAAIGVAAAQGNNGLGVSGSCPNCRIMPIRFGSSRWAAALAFDYARVNGADMVTNSWGFGLDSTASTRNLIAAISRAATEGRGGRGTVVFFAMNNLNVNDCIGSTPDISSLANVIAVSASTNRDLKVRESAFGDCMDILAPTHRGYNPPYRGTLNIVTTDRRGTNGYNIGRPLSGCPSTEPSSPPANAQDYTFCFRGTSSATPLTAGIAGLVLDVKPDLSRQQVQRLLQDTADKIEPGAAAYSTVTGFSDPASGAATHGYGRVNAYEAVRVVAPVEDGGRGGVDIFIRDNRLDWGNTEQPSNTLFASPRGFIGHYESVDIKVDSPRDGYQTPPTTAAEFDALRDEPPLSSARNRVYVRVRNRGPVTAANVTVKLHWTFAGTGLPALPDDFWSSFPADASDTSRVHPIGVERITDLAYSGSSVAGSGTDAAQIVQFEWDAPEFDPTLANPEHYCLFAVIDSPQDRVSADSRARRVIDAITPNDNNITHRNLNLEDSSTMRTSERRFFVRNPYDHPITSVLRLIMDKDMVASWQTEVAPFQPDEPFAMEPNSQVLVTLKVELPETGVSGELEVQQEVVTANSSEVLGGIVYHFDPAHNMGNIHSLYLPSILASE